MERCDTEEIAVNKTGEVFNYEFFAPERIDTKDMNSDMFHQALKFSVTINTNILARKST